MAVGVKALQRTVAKLAVLAGLSVSPCAVAQTVATVNPTADAFVTTGPSNNLINNNYGTLGALEISGTAAARSGTGFRGVFDSVLRFDLTSVKASFDTAYGPGLWTVQEITLGLSTSASTSNPMFNTNSTGQFSVVWMQDDNWVEGTGSTPADGITYATLPGFLGPADQPVGTYTFDTATSGGDGFLSTYALSPGSGLTSDVLTGGLASFELLAATSGVSYLVNSTNFNGGTRRPILTITAVPEPSIAFLFGAAVLMALPACRVARFQACKYPRHDSPS